MCMQMQQSCSNKQAGRAFLHQLTRKLPGSGSKLNNKYDSN